MLFDKPSFKCGLMTNLKSFRISAALFAFHAFTVSFPLAQSHSLIQLQCPLVRCLVPPNCNSTRIEDSHANSIKADVASSLNSITSFYLSKQ